MIASPNMLFIPIKLQPGLTSPAILLPLRNNYLIYYNINSMQNQPAISNKIVTMFSDKSKSWGLQP